MNLRGLAIALIGVGLLVVASPGVLSRLGVADAPHRVVVNTGNPSSGALSPARMGIFESKAVRDLKAQVCEKDAAGNPLFRVLDDAGLEDLSKEAAWVQDTVGDFKDKPGPWAIIGSYRGDYPEDTDTALRIMRREMGGQ